MGHHCKFLLITINLFLFSLTIYAKDPTECKRTTQSFDVINPLVFSEVGTVINNVNLSNQENCFEQLTAKDKIFLSSLAGKMSQSCQQSNKVKNSFSDCDGLAQKIINDDIEDYKAKNGTAAKQRILVAIHAEAKKQQIGVILKTFQDPKIAPTFKKFSDSMIRYQKSLAAVAFEDIRPDDPDSKWDKATTWMHQRTAMVIDLVKTKISTTAESRYRENDRAAQQLLFSVVEMNSKIKELPLSEEDKSQLMDQVSLINSTMRERYNGVTNKINQEAKLSMVGSGGLASAALVVASAGTFGPVFMSAFGGEFAVTTTGAALSGATISAGITGVTHVSDISLSALAAANNNVTAFVCELARQVDNNGNDALKDVMNSAWQGALMGGALGGSIGVVAKKAPKFAIAFSAIFAAGIGGNSLLSIKENFDQITNANQKVKKAKEAKQRGEISEGDLVDVEAKSNITIAHAQAKIVGDAAMVGTLVTGIKVAHEKIEANLNRDSIGAGTRSLKSSKNVDKKIVIKNSKNIENELSKGNIQKAISLIQQDMKKTGIEITPAEATAIIKAHGDPKAACSVGKCTKVQLAQKIEIMKIAGIEPNTRRAVIERGWAGALSKEDQMLFNLETNRGKVGKHHEPPSIENDVAKINIEVKQEGVKPRDGVDAIVATKNLKTEQVAEPAKTAEKPNPVASDPSTIKKPIDSIKIKIENTESLREIQPGDQVQLAYEPLYNSFDHKYERSASNFLYGEVKKIVTDENGKAIGVILERFDQDGKKIKNAADFENTVIWFNDILSENSLIKKASPDNLKISDHSISYKDLRYEDSGEFMLKVGSNSKLAAPVSINDDVILSYHGQLNGKYHELTASGLIIGFEYENGKPVGLKILDNFKRFTKPPTKAELNDYESDIKIIKFDDIILTEGGGSRFKSITNGNDRIFTSPNSPQRKLYDGAAVSWRKSTASGIAMSVDSGDFMLPLNRETSSSGEGKKIPITSGDSIMVYFKKPQGSSGQGFRELLVTKIVVDNTGKAIGFNAEGGSVKNPPDFIYKFEDIYMDRSYVQALEDVNAIWKGRVNKEPIGLKKAQAFKSNFSWEEEFKSAYKKTFGGENNPNPEFEFNPEKINEITAAIQPRKANEEILSIETWMKNNKIDTNLAGNMTLKRSWAYWLLGVENNANEEISKKALRKLYRDYHPDKYSGTDAREIDKLTEISKQLSEIKKILDI